ncbi:MAG: ribosomal protein S18-alanine N-acetyltransferase [Dehalococcoidia bacterium]|nr:ribosomal protein S18-alanine N-acetyltransferase [Dehalococcoidia bacterium]
MDVAIRPIIEDDLDMVARIERQAFPTLCPPTPLKREMGNRRVRYLVAWEPLPLDDGETSSGEYRELGTDGSIGGLGKLMGAVKDRLGQRKVRVPTDYLVQGFVGLWFVADEAHITAIAVEEDSRRRGIGELLIIGSIYLAMHLNSAVVSLEARVSNYPARALYHKYGFEHVGLRKAYYTDNREDAVIMTTQPIHSPDYQARFMDLRRKFSDRYGEASIVVV